MNLIDKICKDLTDRDFLQAFGSYSYYSETSWIGDKQKYCLIKLYNCVNLYIYEDYCGLSREYQKDNNKNSESHSIYLLKKDVERLMKSLEVFAEITGNDWKNYLSYKKPPTNEIDLLSLDGM